MAKIARTIYQNEVPRKLQVKIVQDAIRGAERIMRQIDARWPGNSVPGKS
jgi:hypothetical protein